MNTGLRRILEPGFRFLFFILLLFAIVSAYYSLWISIAEGAFILLIFLFYHRLNIRRKRELTQYIEQIAANVDAAAADGLLNCPLPIAVIRLYTSEIIWSNDEFLAITRQKEHRFDAHVEKYVPGFSLKWLIEGKKECPDSIALHGRQYRVSGNIVRPDSKKDSYLLATLFWQDITELNEMRAEMSLTSPITAIILFDNYEECMKNIPDSKKSSILAALDERINKWIQPSGGLLRKYERDKYVFIFEQRYLSTFISDKFSVLDSVHEVTGAGDTPVTISIGMATDRANFEESFSLAHLAIDMALSRGGDQVVIKNKFNFEFYGGHSKETEKRTKVKSRVMSSALTRLIQDSTRVLAMGHTSSDVDSIGAAAGITCICRKLGKKCNIVYNPATSQANGLVSRLQEQPAYKDVFIDGQSALLEADSSTLLVVVDCNRPEIVDDKELLQSMPKIALIDHHRRSASYIDNVAFNFHEPYASSTCELVCELMQYICDLKDITRAEADALLSGIVLDTKNFSQHTGVRTFEAAAYLRSAGADPILIKRLLQTDLKSSMIKSDIIRKANMLHGSIAISAIDKEVERALAAQAADSFLDISGIQASFVLAPKGSQIIISARSLGEINVQLICEKLGGGGHHTVAGAQLKDTTLEAALAQLTSAINQYIEESNPVI